MTVTETEISAESSATTDSADSAVGEPSEMGVPVGGSAHHVVIGKLWLSGGLIGTVVAGVMLAVAGFNQVGDSPALATAVTNLLASHPFALAAMAAMPLALGLAIAVVPLQIGASTMSLPRLAAGSFWLWAGSSVMYVVGVFAADAQPLDMTRLAYLALAGMIVGVLGGVTAVAVTVLTQRTMGMGIAQVPFFTFAMLVTAAVWVGNLPPVVAHIAFAVIRRGNGPDFVTYALADNSWALRQPAIFALAIPVLGLFADVAMTGARRAPKAVGVIQGLIGALGVLSFGAWAEGLRSIDNIVYIAVIVLIALPVLGVMGLSFGGLRGAKTVPSGPFVAAMLGLDLVLLGAIVGLIQAIDQIGEDGGGLLGLAGVAERLFLGQSYLVAIGAITGLLGGVAYWGSKIWGGPFPENSGLISGGVASLAGVIVGGAWAVAAIATADDLKPYEIATGVGGALLALAVLPCLAAVLAAARRPGGPANPWDGVTLEWATTSPPQPGNFPDGVPEVVSIAPLAPTDEEADS